MKTPFNISGMITTSAFALILTAGQTLYSGVTIRDYGTTSHTQEDAGRLVVRSFDLETGSAHYNISHNVRMDQEGEFVKFHLPYSGVGLGPNTGNWYRNGGGFFTVLLNGHHILSKRRPEIKVVSQGAKGIIQFDWQCPEADVTLHLGAYPQDNKLLLGLDLKPKVEVNTLSLILRCYPHYFRFPGGGPVERAIQTDQRNAEEGDKLTLTSSENWIFYYDRQLRMNGPCALLWPKGAFPRVEVKVDYAVSTTLTYPPETRSISLALWDFTDIAPRWQEALKAFQRSVPAAMAELAKENFQPTIITILEP